MNIKSQTQENLFSTILPRVNVLTSANHKDKGMLCGMRFLIVPLPVGFRQNLPAPQLRKKILHWVKCRKVKA